MRRKVFILSLLAVGLVAAHVSSAGAQPSFPGRPIEVIIPYPPGGVSDLGIRYFADKWAEFLGQPVIPVNKPGGNSTLGATLVAAAKPDGHTLLAGSDSPLITARFGVKGVAYNLDSFRIVFQYSKLALFFTVKADSRWKSLGDLLAEAKQNPRKLTYSSYGVGAITHYATELLSQATGARLTYVPQKSTPEALTALAGGHVDLAVTAGLGGMRGSPLVRPLATSSENRLPDYPDLPTLKELGHPIVLDSTVVLAAPKSVPEEVIRRLVNAHVSVMRKYDGDIKEKMPKLNQYPEYIESDAITKILKERERMYVELAPRMGLKLD